MTDGLRLLQPKIPETPHSGRYFLIALALHGLVLFYPQRLGVDRQEISPPVPVTVTLAEKPTMPQPLPVAKPVAPERPLAPKPVPQEKPLPAKTPTPRPVIAMNPAPSSAPATFTVPAPTVAPVVTATPAAATHSAPPAVSPARFDADYLHNPHPEYPPISRRLGEEGKVLLKVRVSPEGKAATVDLEKSSNFERLDDAARRSVARWRFVPAKRGDEAIEATVIVPIVFRLDN